MPDCTHLDRIDVPPGWQASLALGFARDGETTRLVRREHRGPLRVQKALYPEGPRACHVILVHPPGGVVGGDGLRIELEQGPGAQVLATTPGAAKWYRANGRGSGQQVLLQVGAGAALEWLPQETIFYEGADVRLEHEVELGEGACYLGMEILCFGRRAAGERFARGRVRQRTRIRAAGRTIWWEQGVLHGGAPGEGALHSPLGLGGHPVCATLLAVGRPASAALLAELRALDPGLAFSQVKNVLVARWLGDEAETARACLLRAWALLRPHLVGMRAVVPRIWHT
ncbi:urease accessory protein UreD [Massilia sp. 9096]|uniref:urease accessory protein UreD n=1 Tax=Massilia sp. 9096 TaxID=1500894 RepID=UPI000AF29F14|nr:urease accessory protein UreD [Massilia sp. 9096]